MARNPTATKEKLLDAFDELLDEHGTAGATLDAVAAKAGVSKGGLLYHFGSKAALIDGSLERLDQLVDEDIEAMKAAGERLHYYYLETSAEVGTPWTAASSPPAASHSRTRRPRRLCAGPGKRGSTYSTTTSAMLIWR